ncbi:MAG: hypothetical protein DWQ49_02540 [Bacteroidetes bacterium]|jgi:hypothetical protein|nr:MAG: hypothetical protein DWQ49_02540 [Bacteroidota bacterium]|tara:strand:+ start:633 stop:863 length:231 start_codon:yes stop_codon:yes gene_type:complete
MDGMEIIGKLRKLITQRYEDIVAAMTSGGVDNMEKYNYMLGQIRTYQYIIQEISSLLKQKEQNDKDGTIIKINRDS